MRRPRFVVALGVLAALAATAAGGIATRPADFAVIRRTVVAAPPAVVYARLVDLRRWAEWNAFERGIGDLRLTYVGPRAGVGAGYHYVSPTAGEGRMTVVAAEPGTRLAVRAEFLKPMRSTNALAFTLAPVAGGTEVTWAMTGRNDFVGKAVSLLVDMDRMVGGKFEQGLADLKRLSEAEAAGAELAAGAPGA